MRLLLLPVVLRLQIYRGYANRFVYDLRIFIPESLILRLGMHVMQNKKNNHQQHRNALIPQKSERKQ